MWPHVSVLNSYLIDLIVSCWWDFCCSVWSFGFLFLISWLFYSESSFCYPVSVYFMAVLVMGFGLCVYWCFGVRISRSHHFCLSLSMPWSLCFLYPVLYLWLLWFFPVLLWRVVIFGVLGQFCFLIAWLMLLVANCVHLCLIFCANGSVFPFSYFPFVWSVLPV